MRAGEAPAPAPSPREPRWTRWDPWLYAGTWGGILVVLALSAWLTPDPTGVGTHTGLGLPPCGLYEVFHKPCPSCGMTTSFALAMHGHLWLAVKAQPAGAAVFAAALWLWLYVPLAWRRRRPFEHLFELRPFLPTVLALIVLILGVWIYRLATGWPQG